MVEQPSIESDAATSDGLQPLELDENIKLLQTQQEEYTSNLLDIDTAISKVANSRKWSFHKDLLLTFLTNKGDSLTLECKLLIGIVARQVLKRSKAEDPPNKTLGQELFVKLKGDANKSNSIALYVSANWPQEMFRQVETDFPSQPDKDLRIQIIKVGLGFVENSFVIDSAKKVDTLKSRNLLWADFSQQVHKWAFENSHKGTKHLLETANSTKTHLQNLGATFSATTEASDVSASLDSHKQKNNNAHVLKDEEDLKRIQERKNEERRAAMKMKMRRGSSTLSNSSPAATAANMSAPTRTPALPSVAPAATNAPTPPIAATAAVAAAALPAPTDVSFSSSNHYQQGRTASAPTVPYAAGPALGTAVNGGSGHAIGSLGSRWSSRRSNDLPTQENPGSAIVRSGWEERVANRPSVHEDRFAERPPLYGDGAASSQYSRRPSEPMLPREPEMPVARPGWEERVALRPPLHGDTGSEQYANADEYRPQHFIDVPPAASVAPSQYPNYQRGSTGGYQASGYGASERMNGSGYEQSDYGPPPIAPTGYGNDRSYSSQGGRGRGNGKRGRGGKGAGYQGRNKRQRSESPSFGSGGAAGRGRGMDLTKPAWMTRQQDEGLGSAPSPARDEPPSGGGRGRHQTQPAWMTRQQGEGLLRSAPSPVNAEPLNGRGRGRGKTLPAWMTQQQ
jgi:hypothetical protein